MAKEAGVTKEVQVKEVKVKEVEVKEGVVVEQVEVGAYSGQTEAISSAAASHSSACLRATLTPSQTPMPSRKADGSYGPLFLPSGLVESPSLNDCSAIAPRSLPSLGIAPQSSASSSRHMRCRGASGSGSPLDTPSHGAPAAARLALRSPCSARKSGVSRAGRVASRA